jgi:glutathione S-transferase
VSHFVVHTIPGSPFGRTVLAVLEEKGLQYRISPVDPGILRSDAFQQVHPFNRIPVLDHGDFRLYESQAIVRYLERITPEPPLMPAGARGAARADVLLGIVDWYLFPDVGRTIGFQRIVAPMLLGRPADEAVCAAAMPAAHRTFAVRAEALGSAPYFGGAQLTLADVALASHLSLLALTPEWLTLTQSRGALVEWLARMESRPSFAATTLEALTKRLADARPAGSA